MRAMDQSPDDREGVAALTEAARALIEEVNKLNKGTGTQLVTLAKRSKTNRRLFTMLAAAGLAALGLIVTTAINYERTDDLAHRLDVAQTTQRQKALCPLYGLFISSKNDKSRAAYPQGVEAYDRAFEIIESGYTVLECTEFIGR